MIQCQRTIIRVKLKQHDVIIGQCFTLVPVQCSKLRHVSHLPKLNNIKEVSLNILRYKDFC